MNTSPRYLVFSGGGLHGLCFCGALMSLEGHVDFSCLRGCIGTSIGALIALALCVGISPHRICTVLISNADWTRVHPSVNVHSVAEKFGIETRSALEYLVELVLSDAGLSPSITLKGAFSLTKKHFCACVSDLTHSRLSYCDHVNFPDLRVVDAVVASMCVPVLFEPIQINGSLCVDGGLVENLPIHFFDLEESLVFRLSGKGNRCISNWGDYVTSVLVCSHRAKEERDVEEAGERGSFVCISVPHDLPSGLELQRVNARLAQHLMTLGYLQACPDAEELKVTAGRMVHLACVVHSSTQEPP